MIHFLLTGNFVFQAQDLKKVELKTFGDHQQLFAIKLINLKTETAKVHRGQTSRAVFRYVS